MKTISVIMPSCLTPYENCADNREAKLIRAIDSFIGQSYPEKRLIIVSDGCERTSTIVRDKYTYEPNISLVQLPKQPLFAGIVRQSGIDISTSEIIAYLDSDDMFGHGHLEAVNKGFEQDVDFVYFDDYVVKDFDARGNQVLEKRTAFLEHKLCGTTFIAHKRSLPVSWIGCDGYGHDWTFIQQLMAATNKIKKIEGCRYYNCHVPYLQVNV